MADEMIKDRIVVGVHSDIVRGRLLREKDLCLTKARHIYVKLQNHQRNS